MRASRQTPIKALETLHQESLKLLHTFATTTRDAAGHKWAKEDLSARASELIQFIKRDIEELNGKLSALKSKHDRTITSGVLNNPHHPLMLQAGGEYFDFIEQATGILTPHSLELMTLIKQDSNQSDDKAAS